MFMVEQDAVAKLQEEEAAKIEARRYYRYYRYYRYRGCEDRGAPLLV